MPCPEGKFKNGVTAENISGDSIKNKYQGTDKVPAEVPWNGVGHSSEGEVPLTNGGGRRLSRKFTEMVASDIACGTD